MSGDLISEQLMGGPAPASGRVLDLSAAQPVQHEQLTEAELEELIQAISEADAEASAGEGTDPAYQAAGEGYRAAAEQFDEAFAARAQAGQDRADARAAALVEDTIGPRLHREEDRVARIFARAADGLYDGQQADFASEQAAVEIQLANGGYGNCGPADEFGRCSSPTHALECSHSQAVDWQASGPHHQTYAASLANFAESTSIELTGAKGGWAEEALGVGSAARGAGLPPLPPGLLPRQQRVYRRMRAIGHPHERALAFAHRAGPGRAPDAGGATRVLSQPSVYGDEDEPGWLVPQQTVELAHELATDWGLDAAPGSPDAAAYLDLLRDPGPPPTAADTLYESMGLGAPPAGPAAQYPGISELRARMGL